MHDYNTIIGVIGLRNEKVSIPVIRKRYGIGCSGIQLILDRYKESGLSWEDFLRMEPSQVEELIYPPKISGKRIFLCLILNATITA